MLERHFINVGVFTYSKIRDILKLPRNASSSTFALPPSCEDINQKLTRYSARQLAAIIVGLARNFLIIKNLVPCTLITRLIGDNCKQNNYRPESADYRRGLSRRGPRSEAIITDHFGRPVRYTL